jgi:MoxR-like ATPase
MTDRLDEIKNHFSTKSSIQKILKLKRNKTLPLTIENYVLIQEKQELYSLSGKMEKIPYFLDCMLWMLQKVYLQQDFFLLGPPSYLKRTLAFHLSYLLARPLRYISLSEDSTESDIFQRREIISKTSVYVNQAAIKAAINGEILVIEGMEKAERNVLPILNNLLENREVNLPNGQILISSSRYDDLKLKGELSRNMEKVHQDFFVIGIG